MVLACLYAYSIVTHTLIIDIPHMAMTHGLLNSFGFASRASLPGLFLRRQNIKPRQREPFKKGVV